LGPEQALVHETVRQAGEAAIAACRPGVEWREVHRAAALVVADGLIELGMLRARRESLVESGAVTLFFPHGVGHMVGLGVRDAGPASDETRELAPGLPRLRVDIPLAPRQAWTVEPGVYVVPALLARARGRDDVVWDRVDQLRGFGGVRLEQNVLIGDDGCEVLTAAVPLAPARRRSRWSPTVNARAAEARAAPAGGRFARGTCPGTTTDAGETVGGGPEPSADLLRQLDDDPLRAADVAEPIAVFIALHLANERRAAGSQASGAVRKCSGLCEGGLRGAAKCGSCPGPAAT